MKTPILYTILFLFLFYLISFAQPGTWSDPVNVSNTDFGSFEPNMAMDSNGHIHLVWAEQIDQYNIYKTEIYYSEYDGNQWSFPCQVSSPETTWASNPRIVIDGNCNPHVIWLHRAIFPDNEIYYSSRINNVWTEPENLTPDLGTSYNPDIAIDSQDRIHAFWVSYFGGINKLIYKVNENGVWQPYEIVNNDSLSFHEIRLRIDSEEMIHLCCSANLVGSTDWDIFYLHTNEGGWDAPLNLSNSGEWTSSYPEIAVDSYNNPHIVYQERITNDIKIIYYSYFNGNNWILNEQLTNDNELSTYPVLSIDVYNTICVIFSNRISAYNPYLLYMFNSAGTWTIQDSISSSYNGTYSSIICGNDNRFYLSFPTGFVYYADIGFTYYTPDNGIIKINQGEFSDTEIKVNPNPFNSFVHIEFFFPIKSNIKMGIYNIKGQLIKKVFEAENFQGSGDTFWDGKDNYDNELCSGIYFMVVKSENIQKIIKLVLIK